MNLPEQAQQTVTEMLQGTSCHSDPAIFLTGVIAGILIGVFCILLYVKVKYRG